MTGNEQFIVCLGSAYCNCSDCRSSTFFCVFEAKVRRTEDARCSDHFYSIHGAG